MSKPKTATPFRATEFTVCPSTPTSRISNPLALRNQHLPGRIVEILPNTEIGCYKAKTRKAMVVGLHHVDFDHSYLIVRRLGAKKGHYLFRFEIAIIH